LRDLFVKVELDGGLFEFHFTFHFTFHLHLACDADAEESYPESSISVGLYFRLLYPFLARMGFAGLGTLEYCMLVSGTTLGIFVISIFGFLNAWRLPLAFPDSF
jgi:hypothetical protein